MRVLSPSLLALAFVPLGAATLEDTLSELKESLAYGKASVYLRARSETVDVDMPAFDDKAHAETLRVSLGYETKPFHAFAVGVQFEGVFNLGDETYNSGFNGETDRPLIGDATDSTELQQAYVKYAPSYVPGLVAVGGRQEINLENQRYIGAVAWRQDWQSFDALSASWKPTQGVLTGAEFYYAFLDDVHRTTPEETALGDINMSGHALNLAYTVCKELRVVGYDYVVDFDHAVGGPKDAFVKQSTNSLGLRGAGAWKFSEPWSVLYAAEFAKQTDIADNPNDVDATYSLLELGAGFKALTLKLGYEVLGGSEVAGDRFTTPLATLHAFQGWADLFTTTPNGGLVDTYVWLSGPLPFAAAENVRVGAAYHDFASDETSDHYGSEIDLLVEYSVKVFDPKLVLGAKYATYKADDGEGTALPGSTINNADTEKIWFYTQYSF